MPKSGLYILFFLTITLLKAQSTPEAFCQYLFEEKKYHELELYTSTLLQQSKPASAADPQNQWSRYLIKAKLKQNPLDSTVLEVDTLGNCADCNLLKIYHLLRTDQTDSVLRYTNRIDSVSHATDLFFIAAFLDLKKNDFAACEARLKAHSDSLLPISQRIVKAELLAVLTSKANQKRKSPLKSALLSAALPGYGKKYAGYKGEAVSSLITNGVLGVVLAESIWRKGLNSIYTWGSGAVFLTFYVSNIVGSYYAAKRLDFQNKRFIDAEITKVINLWADGIYLR
jgi:hypothetical protein